MTIIVVRNQEAAGRTRQGTFAPAQPCATRDSAQIKTSSTRVASTAPQKAGYRIRVGKRAGDRQCRFPLKSDPASSGKNLPASFQSAHASRAVTAGVLSVISAPLRLFILRAVKVAPICTRRHHEPRP